MTAMPSQNYAQVSNKPDPLGVTLVDGGVNVALFADNATAVDFCIRNADGSETRWRLPDKARGIWHGFVPGVEAGARYGFRVHGEWNPQEGHRHNPNKFLIDPYAKAIDGNWVLHEAVFGYKQDMTKPADELIMDTRDSAPFMPCAVVVKNDFDWTGDVKPDTRWHKTVIYEAHVKGMTMQHPDVPEHLRGTYEGLAHPAIINHLHSIGVTAIELLPVHQIGHEEHLVRMGMTNYWGYNTLGFFAPHHAYSSSGHRGEQINEFKQMVKTFHQNGIEVLLDVVYNHTCEGGPLGPMMSFKGIDNASYYRLVDEDPQHYFDTTGCSNTLNTYHPQVMQLVLDSLRYWVTEMHVDGFRFDLAPSIARINHDVDLAGPLMQAIAQDPILRNSKLIAEPWDLGDGGYQVGNYPRIWSEWNDRFRDTARDFWRGLAPGVSELASRLSGSSDLFVDEDRRPRASINFITAHDGFTMRDLVSFNQKHNEANREGNRDGNDHNRSWNHGVEGETTDPAILQLRLQQQRNMMLMLLLSSGVPMITAGDEHGRTQGGNNNAYCQDTPISWVDWNIDGDRADILQTFQTLMQMRKEHPAFHHRNYRWGSPTLVGGPKDVAWFSKSGFELDEDEWLDTEIKTIGMFINQNTQNGDDSSTCSFLVILHSGGESVEFTLPDSAWAAQWQIEFDTTLPGAKSPDLKMQPGQTMRVFARSALVLRAIHA
jgi:isoamylase